MDCHKIRHSLLLFLVFLQGPTWTAEIVWQIYNEGRTSDTRLNKRVPFFEGNKLLSSNTADSRPSLESRASPRLTHSHLPFHVIPKGHPKETQCKYIYIARNPKDVAVSYFHFLKSFGEDVCGFRGSFEFLVKIFTQGEVHYGFWHEHVLGWWKHRNDSNILFLKYEDLKKNLEKEVRKIIAFLGKNLQEETIKAITKQCTFKEMNKNRSIYWVSVPDGPSLLRKGEIGDWKHYFTPELNEEFEMKILSKLEGTGLTFDFE